MRTHLLIENGSAPTLATLDEAVAFIDEVLADPGARMYVHAVPGSSAPPPCWSRGTRGSTV